MGHGSGCVLSWVCVPISFTRARTKSGSIKNDRRFLIFEKGWVNVYYGIIEMFLRFLQGGG